MLERILNLIFPLKCIFCGNILEVSQSKEICKSCFGKISFTDKNLYHTLLNKEENNYCDGIVCVCEYSGIIKESLITYKFFNKPGHYRTFAHMLSQRLKEMTDCKGFDIIVSIPLHKKREYIRGYNQSKLISKALSKQLKIIEASFVLKRVFDTRTQSLLNRNLRKMNVKGAFRADYKDFIKGKTILLVDDILTTGNTINECCRVLKEAGAKKVFAAVIATGRKY
ncbi:MAG: ComF family protein [Clostridia bacterium]